MTSRTPAPHWRKSSFSQGQSTCVEVAAVNGGVGLRDSKQQATSPVLRFSHDQWHKFLTEVVGGHASRNGVAVVTTGPQVIHCNDQNLLTEWHVTSADGTKTLHYTEAEWQAFVRGAASGEFSIGTVDIGAPSRG